MSKTTDNDQIEEDPVMEWYNFLMYWKPECVILDKEADKVLVNLLTGFEDWKILEDERDLIIFSPLGG